MKILLFAASLLTLYTVFCQQEITTKEVHLADSTLLAGGRVITLIDDDDFTIFTDYEKFLNELGKHKNSPAAVRILEAFTDCTQTGNISADSIITDKSLIEALKIAKGVVIGTGNVIMINKKTELAEKTVTIDGDGMCFTIRSNDRVILYYCYGNI